MARSKILLNGAASRPVARRPSEGTAKRQDFAPPTIITECVLRPSGSAQLKKLGLLRPERLRALTRVWAAAQGLPVWAGAHGVDVDLRGFKDATLTIVLYNLLTFQ